MTIPGFEAGTSVMRGDYDLKNIFLLSNHRLITFFQDNISQCIFIQIIESYEHLSYYNQFRIIQLINVKEYYTNSHKFYFCSLRFSGKFSGVDFSLQSYLEILTICTRLSFLIGIVKFIYIDEWYSFYYTITDKIHLYKNFVSMKVKISFKQSLKQIILI